MAMVKELPLLSSCYIISGVPFREYSDRGGYVQLRRMNVKASERYWPSGLRPLSWTDFLKDENTFFLVWFPVAHRSFKRPMFSPLRGRRGMEGSSFIASFCRPWLQR